MLVLWQFIVRKPVRKTGYGYIYIYMCWIYCILLHHFFSLPTQLELSGIIFTLARWLLMLFPRRTQGMFEFTACVSSKYSWWWNDSWRSMIERRKRGGTPENQESTPILRGSFSLDDKLSNNFQLKPKWFIYIETRNLVEIEEDHDTFDIMEYMRPNHENNKTNSIEYH